MGYNAAEIPRMEILAQMRGVIGLAVVVMLYVGYMRSLVFLFRSAIDRNTDALSRWQIIGSTGECLAQQLVLQCP